MQPCPRWHGPNSPFKYPKPKWTYGKNSVYSVCNYCGSMHPDRFFRNIKEGIKLSPTDKNYKVYVETGKHGMDKFYWYHLNEEEKKKFVSLMNEGKVKNGLSFPAVTLFHGA